MPDEEKKPAAESFPEMEEAALRFWDSADIFNKSLKKVSPRGDYVFYDGPPFATGTPHYGHIVASIMKDIVPRYQTMRGYHVERKWGWDCHGLPIENIVEKELGTKTKKEIIDLGVAKFNDLCRSQVSTYVDEWKKVIKRLGRWADMEHAYKTMDLDFMDSIWWSFKQLWDKDLIYKDYRSMHICPRCETTLSQSEVTEGYRDIKDLSCIAKFELVDEPGTFVLAWTTTPWTLVGNVALAVGREIKYLQVLSGEEKFILAAERAADVLAGREYQVLAELSGVDLVGKSYKPLFNYYVDDLSLANRENGWKIYPAEFVTTTDGTGVVHIAPAFGEDDMNLGREHELPFIQHVGMDGIFKPEVKDFVGLHVKPIDDHTTTDVEIIKYLAKNNLLFSKEKYEHSYPHCWRCDTPLINYATSSWFVNVTKIKEQLLNSAKEINWSPDYLKAGRFGNWLEGARDWSISRQRFWASAIPIWECACGERRVVGSVAELSELSGQDIKDIHKDKVDPVVFACAKCGAPMHRISDVLDCWFESGSMPFAQLHYPMANKEQFDKNFPAQFIAEGVDQTRAWFYYLHVIAGGIFQKHAFQNVIVNGIVLAEDGKKMSKRLHNYPDPMLVMEKYGSDALRAYLSASPVMQAENLNFSEKGVQESLRKNIMVLWNVYKFYELFADLKAAQTTAMACPSSANVLDKWILAKLNVLIEGVTDGMENYNLPKAIRPLTSFIDELSTWYLRRSRDRFKSADEIDKQNALDTSAYVLLTLSKLMAPFMPFIAETLWQKVSAYNFNNPDKSVHLEEWPQSGEKDADILERMEIVRRIVELGLAKRDEAGVKIRQMLGELRVYNQAPLVLSDDYQKLITDELNIKQVSFITALKSENLSVELDTNITSELRQEGLKRELVRLINMLRKDSSLNIGDQAAVYVAGAGTEIETVIAAFKDELKRDTLSSSLEIVPSVVTEFKKEVKIDAQSFWLGLEKIS